MFISTQKTTDTKLSIQHNAMLVTAMKHFSTGCEYVPVVLPCIPTHPSDEQPSIWFIFPPRNWLPNLSLVIDLIIDMKGSKKTQLPGIYINNLEVVHRKYLL